MPVSVYILGLTGGIGSGKSTVAGLLSAHGAGVVDTDAIAHQLTAPGGRAINAIRKRLGDQFIGPDGALDRAATRNRVFADATLKQQLEAILHPLISEEVDILLRSTHVLTAAYAVLVVPLLFEGLTYRERLQRTLLVDCPVASQLDRVTRRAGVDRRVAERIVNAQLPRSVRLQLADDLLWNGDGIDVLEPQVTLLHQRYVQRAKLHP
jgi:dephospho-CoA kinase